MTSEGFQLSGSLVSEGFQLSGRLGKSANVVGWRLATDRDGAQGWHPGMNEFGALLLSVGIMMTVVGIGWCFILVAKAAYSFLGQDAWALFLAPSGILLVLVGWRMLEDR